jgi:hypothetical protein
MRHHDDLPELFGIAAVHAREECAEHLATGLALALVEVMGNILAQAVEHRVPVAAVERGVVALDEFDRLDRCAVLALGHAVLVWLWPPPYRPHGAGRRKS